ncbi:hypothetical protein, partial [Actinokineospora sp.]|uniref:hypothetical protein n=1 Tax=Actinokineospora sp. TaxID=1872133 RepID=UPI004037E85B
MAHTRLAPTDGSPKRERGWPRALLLVVVVGVAYFVGFAALVSAAKITAEPAVLVLAGLAAAVLVNGAGVALAMRRRPPGRRRANSPGVFGPGFQVTTQGPHSGAAAAPAAPP